MIEYLVNTVNDILTNYVLVTLLLMAAVVFTILTKGVQFRMVGEMFRLLISSGDKKIVAGTGEDSSHHTISSFQAFMVSIASRVGTGNLAGVAMAIMLGGPGAIFWMWVIALLGAATSFIESTLAQLFKVKGENSFIGGPAYYILKGIGERWWAITFAVLITITFGLTFSSVQANTISFAFENSFGISPVVTGVALTIITLIIVWGGIQRIAKFSEIVVPIMAIAYILLAIVIIIINIKEIPSLLALIVENAFGFEQAMGGGIGMAIVMGVKRGLFSNEAGEGSTPNAAATASVSHPVKQGLIQALGVFTDTLIICTCTAFIILCSDVWQMPGGADGIVLTQNAIDAHLHSKGLGSTFISIAILFFAFTSIIANYYYGEANLLFIRCSKALITTYKLCVGAIVMIGSISSLSLVWSIADITMALMTICNLAALCVLGKYAIRCLNDYRKQRKAGLDPHYRKETIPEIAAQTECW